MARSLSWIDLSQSQVDDLNKLSTRPELSQYLAKAFPLKDYAADMKQGILMDLYIEILRYGKAAQFPPEQLSAFFSIIKLNHFQAVSERLTLERSFEFFKELLLRHSVQRPPFSVGLFSFHEMKAITEWMMDSYYRHYKLYQYVFTPRFTCDFKEAPPLVEVLPPLVPLAGALSARQWEEHQAALAAAAAEAKAVEDAKAAEEAARLAEEARVAEYMSAVPDEVVAAVQKVFDEKIVGVRADMETQFKAQEDALLAKISELEKAAAGGAAAGTPKSGTPK